MFALPKLPYADDALAPVISAHTIEFHYGKHHAAYVKNLNALLAEQGAAPASLEAVIENAKASAQAKVFNNAAQCWNHSFFWLSMSPTASSASEGLSKAITAAYGDHAGLKAAFVAEGVAHFGSGWVWLAADRHGALKILSTHDAETPLSHVGLTPLLVCDLWEHAYYLDHQNDRKGFLEAWFDRLANWTFASEQFAAATSGAAGWRHPAAT